MSAAAAGPSARGGTPGWRAPELTRRSRTSRTPCVLTTKVDVWSAGCILVVMDGTPGHVDPFEFTRRKSGAPDHVEEVDSLVGDWKLQPLPKVRSLFAELVPRCVPLAPQLRWNSSELRLALEGLSAAGNKMVGYHGRPLGDATHAPLASSARVVPRPLPRAPPSAASNLAMPF